MDSLEETALLSYRIVSERSKTSQLDLVAVSKYTLPMGIVFKRKRQSTKYKVTFFWSCSSTVQKQREPEMRLWLHGLQCTLSTFLQAQVLQL